MKLTLVILNILFAPFVFAGFVWEQMALYFMAGQMRARYVHKVKS